MKSMKRKKGFTLAELLIVVAIIGVLVAISIPIFTSQLKKARKAKNWANMRAAYASAIAEFLAEGAPTGERVTYEYTVSDGKCIRNDKPIVDVFSSGESFETVDVPSFAVEFDSSTDQPTIRITPGYNQGENEINLAWALQGDPHVGDFPSVPVNGSNSSNSDNSDNSSTTTP